MAGNLIVFAAEAERNTIAWSGGSTKACVKIPYLNKSNEAFPMASFCGHTILA
jgi:hypothetical protein